MGGGPSGGAGRQGKIDRGKATPRDFRLLPAFTPKAAVIVLDPAQITFHAIVENLTALREAKPQAAFFVPCWLPLQARGK